MYHTAEKNSAIVCGIANIDVYLQRRNDRFELSMLDFMVFDEFILLALFCLRVAEILRRKIQCSYTNPVNHAWLCCGICKLHRPQVFSYYWSVGNYIFTYMDS